MFRHCSTNICSSLSEVDSANLRLFPKGQSSLCVFAWKLGVLSYSCSLNNGSISCGKCVSAETSS